MLVVLGDQTVVVAAVVLEGLAELVDETATGLQVLEDDKDDPDFGVGVELDVAEAVDDLLMVGAEADFEVGIESCTAAGRTAVEAEHMKQVVQIHASCFGMVLAMVAGIADTPAGIGHTADIAACKDCIQAAAAAGSIASIGAAAGKTGQLLEFVKQNLMQLNRKEALLLPCLLGLHQLPLLLRMQNLLQLWLYLMMAGLWL